MKTIILGLCEINDRHYFVGLWPDIETCKKELHPVYTVEDYPISVWGDNDSLWPHPKDYNSVNAWNACDTGITVEDDHISPVGSDVDGFSLYEIPIDRLPGYIGFDED
jgi:hypothetical protein